MPRSESYIVRIWQSRTIGGWRWAARVEDLADGRLERFVDRHALLAHLEGIVMEHGVAELNEGETDDHAPSKHR